MQEKLAEVSLGALTHPVLDSKFIKGRACAIKVRATEREVIEGTRWEVPVRVVHINIDKAKMHDCPRAAEQPGTGRWIARPVLGSVLQTKHSGIKRDGLGWFARVDIDVVKTLNCHEQSLRQSPNVVIAGPTRHRPEQSTYCWRMTHQRWFRIALGYLAVVALEIGAWAVLAPQSFYDNFPGVGRAWVSVDGPFNEHLIRDVGALNLALFVVLVYAAVTLSRHLINAACLASIAWGAPHLIYHAVNTEPLGAGDNAISLAGLAFGVGLPLLLLANTSKLETQTTS